jgi:hypothetical protein
MKYGKNRERKKREENWMIKKEKVRKKMEIIKN